MIDDGKRNVIGSLVDACDYEAAIQRIISSATARQPLAATALAVHGLVESHRDEELRYRVNHLDLVVPDGQPVRWALNLLHGTKLSDRVRGPTLMLKLCERASMEDIGVYLYGSTHEVLQQLVSNLRRRHPSLRIVGAEPSRFRQITAAEKQHICRRIRESGAGLVFVGLGCPRQEVWAYEYRAVLSIPVVAVGAAFDFHAGALKEAPSVMQRWGLEWLFRLYQEPRRLWRRYLTTNTTFLSLAAGQLLWRIPDPVAPEPRGELRFG